MTIMDNCDYQRLYSKFIDGEWQVVAVSHQQCSYSDYSGLVSPLGLAEFDDGIEPDDFDDCEAERLVHLGDVNRFAYSVVHENGNMYVADMLNPIWKSDEMFRLGASL